MRDEEQVMEINKRLLACKHVITRAGANALERYGDPTAILLEVIEHLAAHVKVLEKFAEQKVNSEVRSLVFKPEEVVVEMPGLQMESTTVYATKEQMSALRSHSKETGVPMAAMIRRGIDLVLEEIKKDAAKVKKAIANT